MMDYQHPTNQNMKVSPDACELIMLPLMNGHSVIYMFFKANVWQKKKNSENTVLLFGRMDTNLFSAVKKVLFVTV